MRRIGELKPNPSPKSHAELNNSTSLQRGDPGEFGLLIGRLRKALPGLKVCHSDTVHPAYKVYFYFTKLLALPNLSAKVFGGCCGTDVEHLECAIKELLHSSKHQL